MVIPWLAVQRLDAPIGPRRVTTCMASPRTKSAGRNGWQWSAVKTYKCQGSATVKNYVMQAMFTSLDSISKGIIILSVENYDFSMIF